MNSHYVTIIMYHYVRSEYTGSGIFGMTCKEFNFHILNLKKKYTIIPPEDFFLSIEKLLLFVIVVHALL